MLGMAVGDALGLPALFLTPVEIRRRFGSRGIADFVGSDYHPKGAVSDDTQTALATAHAIVEARGRGVDALGAAAGSRLVAWSRGTNLDRAPDATLMRGINRLSEGVPWRGSGDPGSKSAGSLARAVPIGAAYAGSPAAIREMAQAACFPTHAHPIAVASFVSAALLTSYAVTDVPMRSWEGKLLRGLGDLASEVSVKLNLAFRLKRDRPLKAFVEIGEGWTADEVVAKALYCVLHHPADFGDAVLLACNASGDTSAAAAIAGAISGAMLGKAGIPPRWRNAVENAGELSAVARELAGICESSLAVA
ncbi:MAG: ADP-ribosylglycohydrolase family protein [Acidobacteriota bacterium]